MNPSSRPFKGKSLLQYPTSFVCLDIETTGLSPVYDDIIEISAIRIRSGSNAGTFSEIINIGRPLPPFISSLTGITDPMIRKGKDCKTVLADFYDFVGDEILLGHNVNFDINFLYDNYQRKLGLVFGNDFVDTLRLSKRLIPELKHHKLDDLSAYFGIAPREEHRALHDCEMTVECYFRMTEK